MADVVYFHLLRRSAQFARAREEPVDQLVATGRGQDRRSIFEGSRWLPVQRYTSETRYQ
ncbi:hypothetical protein FrEUN1fDRAFT_7506, partial [Parafrankia sp. EUN1f]